MTIHVCVYTCAGQPGPRMQARCLRLRCGVSALIYDALSSAIGIAGPCPPLQALQAARGSLEPAADAHAGGDVGMDAPQGAPEQLYNTLVAMGVLRR